VQRFTLELEHEGGTHTPLTVALAGPSRDAQHLQVLAHSRLEQLSVAAPVRALVLAADAFAPVRVRQFDLFAVRSSEEDEWQAVLDRLRARLGPAAVQSLGLHADHRPEKSWTPMPASANAEGMRRERPLWLLPEPRALPGRPECTRGPERIEGGWWDGADVQRDYYLARTGEGSRLWVYRERQSGKWFLHGLWA
jgi:protein ImuB